MFEENEKIITLDLKYCLSSNTQEMKQYRAFSVIHIALQKSEIILLTK